MVRAMYAFSGDPITNGHKDVVKRAADVFDEVIVGIGVNPDKSFKYTFSLAEREEMAKKALVDISNVKVISFRGMLVDYAYEQKIPVIIKGVRNAEDADYENNLDQIGRSQKLGIDTHILFARPELMHISSSNVKGIQAAQGDVHEYVHPYIKQCLEARMSGQYMVGLTGEICSGKSYIGKKLETIGQEYGIEVHNIELDHVGHEILESLTDPIYEDVRTQIIKTFEEKTKNKDGTINRKVLGEIVFNNQKELEKLNDIMYTPLMVRLRRELLGKKGLFLINAALIAESDWSYLNNNNTLFVDVDENSQEKRMLKRGLTTEQIKTRLNTQYNSAEKKSKLINSIQRDNHGMIWTLDNSDDANCQQIKTVFNQIISEMDIYGELRFRALWERINADGTPDEEYKRIVQSYSQSSRFYHDLEHVITGINAYEESKHLMEEPNKVLFAWFYHDIIMKKKSQVDEEASAEIAYNVCRQAVLTEGFAKNVKELIIFGTKHKEIPKTIDQKLISDIDLAIFGKTHGEFDEYNKDIWEEWSWVGRERFADGRKKVLDKFLKRQSIYFTDFFKERYEEQAKENLTRARSAL